MAFKKNLFALWRTLSEGYRIADVVDDHDLVARLDADLRRILELQMSLDSSQIRNDLKIATEECDPFIRTIRRLSAEPEGEYGPVDLERALRLAASIHEQAGNISKALALIDEAAEIGKRLRLQDATDAREIDHVSFLIQAAHLNFQDEAPESGYAFCKEAHRKCDELLERSDLGWAEQVDLAIVCDELSILYGCIKKFEVARAIRERGMSIRRALVRTFRFSDRYHLQLAGSLHLAAINETIYENFSLAARYGEEALLVRREEFKRRCTSETLSDLSQCLDKLSEIASSAGDAEKGLAYEREKLAALFVFCESRKNPDVLDELASCLADVCKLLVEFGRIDEALAVMREAIPTYEKRVEMDDGLMALNELASVLGEMAELELGRGNVDRARDYCDQCVSEAEAGVARVDSVEAINLLATAKGRRVRVMKALAEQEGRGAG